MRLSFVLTLLFVLAACGEGEGIPVADEPAGASQEYWRQPAAQPPPQPQPEPQPQTQPDAVPGAQPTPQAAAGPEAGEDPPEVWVDDPPPAGGEDPPPPADDPPAVDGTVGIQVQAVFDARCSDAGCHDLVRPVLAPDAAFGELVGAPAFSCDGMLRVAPGDPDKSCLILRIETANFGAQMPQGRAALTPEGLAAVRAWIESL